VLQTHLNAPYNRGPAPRHAHSGAAGGAACGDLVRLSIAVEGERVAAATFDASGCGAALGAGSAAATLADGAHVLDAARISPQAISDELGGLIPPKRHAAELAADALHRALGAAVRAQASLSSSPGRTLVAMSGGVDSAVAALLAGDDAVAVTLELWADAENDGERSCCSASAVRTARAMAHDLGLAHLTLDLREEFRAGVVSPFLDDHAAGLTPNPCVRCNGHVRLDAMIDLATRLGAPALATGHYARVHDDGEGPLLRMAADPQKDQTYMLAALSPDSLARLRFPLGDMTKPAVRVLAQRAALPVASKPDSQDLCFLAGTERGAFLARHGNLRSRPGDVVDRSGTRLGRHRGHHAFTVGQRKGLGVAASAPLYVLDKDAAANRVVVGPKSALRRSEVHVSDVTLHREAGRVDAAKLRYRSPALRGRVTTSFPAGMHPSLDVALDEPVLGAAPGQAAVLLDGDLVVGHGTIAAA
jgi:tRNA-uridine 2-sulfurtransferase